MKSTHRFLFVCHIPPDSWRLNDEFFGGSARVLLTVEVEVAMEWSVWAGVDKRLKFRHNEPYERWHGPWVLWRDVDLLLPLCSSKSMKWSGTNEINSKAKELEIKYDFSLVNLLELQPIHTLSVLLEFLSVLLLQLVRAFHVRLFIEPGQNPTWKDTEQRFEKKVNWPIFHLHLALSIVPQPAWWMTSKTQYFLDLLAKSPRAPSLGRRVCMVKAHASEEGRLR